MFQVLIFDVIRITNEIPKNYYAIDGKKIVVADKISEYALTKKDIFQEMLFKCHKNNE